MIESKPPGTSLHHSAVHTENDCNKASQTSGAGKSTTRRIIRTQSETRLMAIRLQDTPPPLFSKKQLELRWQIGPDTVRKLLLQNNIDPGPKKGLLIALFDVLSVEQVNDPIGLWVTATEGTRAVLSADLLTLDEWRAGSTENTCLHSDTYYRRSQKGLLQSIRIGKFHRFRRNADQASQWLSSRGRYSA